MALRKHRPGELVVEQTRDLARVRNFLEHGGMITDGVEWPAACYLIAFIGDEPVGAIGVEPVIDAALLRSLFVVESMRRRHIGAALVAAARKAAHTRGARHLYLFSTGAGTRAGDFWIKQGFEPASVADMLAAMRGAPEVEYYRAHPEKLAEESAFHLDISRDGLIDRS